MREEEEERTIYRAQLSQPPKAGQARGYAISSRDYAPRGITRDVIRANCASRFNSFLFFFFAFTTVAARGFPVTEFALEIQRRSMRNARHWESGSGRMNPAAVDLRYTHTHLSKRRNRVLATTQHCATAARRSWNRQNNIRRATIVHGLN